MPYITQARRNDLADGQSPATYGELNYLVTRILLDELGPRESWGYAKLNRMVGIICNLQIIITRGTVMANVSADDMRIINRIVDATLVACGGGWGKNVSDLLGVFECVKLEFYRRIVAPYEDAKIAENGDVF